MGKCLLNSVPVVMAALVVSACTGYSCREPQVYQSAHSVPPIEVPEDLEEQDLDAQRIVIPRAAEDAPKPDPDDPCLDEPPDFFGEEEVLQ